jgi:hypothetical protein
LTRGDFRAFGIGRGLESFLADWLPYRETFDEWRIEVEELIEGRGERVVACVHDGGRWTPAAAR